MKKVKGILLALFFIMLVCLSSLNASAKNKTGAYQSQNVNLKAAPSKYNVTMARSNSLEINCHMWGDSVESKYIDYKSSNRSVISVNSRGIAKAKKAGRAIITCQIDSNLIKHKAVINVTVLDNVHIKKIKAEKSLIVEKGDYEYIGITTVPEYAPDRRMTYKSSNRNVVKVTKEGKCIGVNTGKATVTVTSKDGKKKSKCKVTVINPVVSDIKIIGCGNGVFDEGTTTKFSAEIYPEHAQDSGVTWSTSDTNVADIDQAGNVSFKSSGSVTIYAQSNITPSVVKAVRLIVKSCISSITITSNKNTLFIEDKTARLTAHVYPDNAPNKNVIWKSTKPEIAEIDQNGVITFKRCGFATFSATSVSGGKAAFWGEQIKTNAPSYVKIDEGHWANVEIKTNEEKDLVVSYDGLEPQIKWESSDSTIISVDENGHIKALRNGTATITATSRWNPELNKYPKDSITFDVSSPMNETGSCGDYLTYSLTGYEDDLTLTINGYGDIKTAGWGTYKLSIKTIILDDRITGICDNAFEQTKISSINLPSKLKKIGKNAFGFCNNITRVSIPEGCTEIGERAFANSGRSRLEYISIPSTINVIGERAFSGNNSLTEVSLPEGFEEIKWGVFNECTSLKKIYLPSTIRIIDGNAFYNCKKLEDIVYNGTKSQWASIKISTYGNTYFNICKVTYANTAP